MNDKEKEKESIKNLEKAKVNTNDQALKDKIDKKLNYVNKPLNK